MKIPAEIHSLAKNGPAGQKLVDVLSSAPDDGNELLTEVVDCFVKVLHERAPDSNGAIARSKPVKISEDLSTASSVVEQLMFLHPRGKHLLGFFPDRLVIQTSKQQIAILSSDVTDVVVCILCNSVVCRMLDHMSNFISVDS